MEKMKGVSVTLMHSSLSYQEKSYTEIHGGVTELHREALSTV